MYLKAIYKFLKNNNFSFRYADDSCVWQTVYLAKFSDTSTKSFFPWRIESIHIILLFSLTFRWKYGDHGKKYIHINNLIFYQWLENILIAWLTLKILMYTCKHSSEIFDWYLNSYQQFIKDWDKLDKSSRISRGGKWGSKEIWKFDKRAVWW